MTDLIVLFAQGGDEAALGALCQLCTSRSNVAPALADRRAPFSRCPTPVWHAVGRERGRGVRFHRGASMLTEARGQGALSDTHAAAREGL